ncbi:MFS transporter [Microbulbifer sp. SAOS-129_SWC]|uniref:MFS transporter n=1 Tax=Microbulbifer sp. SAOS-129_SWC TaxID=3145235 RepID=UPI003216DFBD
MQKPQLSFWQIWNMCFGFIGIQFGFALQNANVSRIFQSLGASIEDIPILWVAAPITGLLIQPVIGYLSDRTWTRFGRRRPYLLAGAVAASLALFAMPNASSLWVAAGLLWILDASLNVMLGPAIALLGDMQPDRQRSTGFLMQGFFIGVSAVVASALPWMLHNWLAVGDSGAAGIAPSVTYAFYVGGLIMLASVIWTALRTREFNPQQLAELASGDNAVSLPDSEARPPGSSSFASGGLLLAGAVGALLVELLGAERQLHILCAGAALFGALQLGARWMHHRGATSNAAYQFTRDLMQMPTTMRQLAVVQFFTWFALFCMWIYGTPAVASYHFGALAADSAAYNRGADWVGVLFSAYNGFAALAAVAIPLLVRVSNRKICHCINLCLGATALMSFYWIHDPTLLLLPMVAMGFAWASILSMPYAILAGSLPAHKMGVYAGIFNFFIVIPQILASSTLALVIHHFFADQTIYAMVLAGVLMLGAAIATLFVQDQPAEVSVPLATG